LSLAAEILQQPQQIHIVNEAFLVGSQVVENLLNANGLIDQSVLRLLGACVSPCLLRNQLEDSVGESGHGAWPRKRTWWMDKAAGAARDWSEEGSVTKMPSR